MTLWHHGITMISDAKEGQMSRSVVGLESGRHGSALSWVSPTLWVIRKRRNFFNDNFDKCRQILTSCARGDTICLRPCKLTISSHLFARRHLFRHAGYLRHQQHCDLLTLKVVSESRATWATSATFTLRRPLCSRVRPDVRDRQTERCQTSDRQTSDKSIA